ncbi:EI24 domain-containing protein [Prochlorothrix hollandica]|uniref:EI24 domain-containing protein n=1 Tax=Prochlorothrix hollandica TaxID=1223 RepID=UPI00334137BF
MLNLITAPFAGITYPLRALRLFHSHPPLRQYLIIPMVINAVVGSGLYWGLLIPGWQRIDRILNGLTLTWEQWVETLPPRLGFLVVVAVGLAGLAKVLFVVGLLLTVGFLLVQFGTLLGAPWYGQLSEKLEKMRTGQVTVVEVGIVRDLGRAIAFELKKLTLALPLGLLCFGLNFVPGFGPLLATSLGLSLGILLICMDFLDPPLERRRLPFRHKLALVFRHFPVTLPFGVVCFGLVSIPFVNLLTVPLCIAGGTLLYCDRIQPTHSFDRHGSSN